jgi:uncharacterized protein
MNSNILVWLMTHHRIPFILTLVSWLAVGVFMGPSAFFLVIVLSLLEITLSADNAVVNSRVLVKMSEFWQKLFLTVGIFIAVFLIRFILPIVLVSVASQTSFSEILQLAWYDAEAYGERLHAIAPIINAFGGIFLFMVATFFFVDIKRRHFWIAGVERSIARLASVPLVKTLVVGVLFGGILLGLPPDMKFSVGIAMLFAVGIYLGLHAITVLMERFEEKNGKKKQVGLVAFGSFMYLEVLDASFSLDGVVGAFALTNNIIVIMIGLGIGALWVRTLTIDMVKRQTLQTYKYLESGAHWAIVFLSLVMLLKLFHIELPEVIVGSIGLLCIGFSVYSSQRHVQRS